MWRLGLPVVAIAFFLSIGLSLISILLILACFVLGLFLAEWISKESDGNFLAPLTQSLLVVRSLHTDAGHDGKMESMDSNSKRRKLPWEGLFLPSAVNDVLESLLDQIIYQYVSEWYEGSISRDRAFIEEIRYQLRFACSTLVRKLAVLDVGTAFSEDILPNVALHVHRIVEFGEDFNDKNSPISLIENSICSRIDDLHYCLGNRQKELNYLRQIADWLVPKLFDSSRLSGKAHDDEDQTIRNISFQSQRTWPAHPARHLLRELLAKAFLMPILDLIADPDIINHLIIISLDESTTAENILLQSKSVPFLYGLTEEDPSAVPDSLLSLKLSDILRDSRQFSMFRLYLQDIRGPVNELLFLAEANRIHHSLQKMDETASQISYDVWQLYSQFVHENAADRIGFSSDVVTSFALAVEKSDLILLDQVIEQSYQAVYQHMQSNFVILFCQSDAFLGYLCGSPPIAVTELISKPFARRNSATERAFSLSSFRSHLRRLLTLSNDPMENGQHFQGNCEHDQYLSQSASSSDFRDDLKSAEVPTISVDELQDIATLPDARGNNDRSIVVDLENRNINTWKINIVDVAPLRDEFTGRSIFGYLVSVTRTDARPHETTAWSIVRRFDEFYVLEAKLMEFHGNALRLSNLPQRKPFTAKTRVYMEQNRLIVSSFLSNLCKQRAIHRSDLLFAFLTSDNEFRDNVVLSELNPWKVVKKVPAKLTRERGQHLQPFLLNTMANALAPPQSSATVRSTTDVGLSETSSVSSISTLNSHRKPSIYSRTYGNNCNGKNVRDMSDGNELPWSRSSSEAVLLLANALLKPVSQWLFQTLAVAHSICGKIADSAMSGIGNKLKALLLDESTLVRLVQLIQQSLYSECVTATDQEKLLREELAKRLLLEFIQDQVPSCAEKVFDRKQLRIAAQRLIQALQYPRLNKQLSYVILDLLLDRIFPTSIMPPLMT